IGKIRNIRKRKGIEVNKAVRDCGNTTSEGSEGAYLFWQHVIQEYTGGKYSCEDGIFTFENIRDTGMGLER
ncbi:MAG TPA: hypothetical protein H9935_02075, partial [Candidatus Blautia merdigallinarum]|nr:hypothetical protein [Candidatus Blautia merdigallinarum]